MFAAAYAPGTVLGDADSRRAAAFRVLALGFLGMDGRCGGVRILLCCGFPITTEWNAGGLPLALTARSREDRVQACSCTSYKCVNLPTFIFAAKITSSRIRARARYS